MLRKRTAILDIVTAENENCVLEREILRPDHSFSQRTPAASSLMAIFGGESGWLSIDI